MRPIRPLSAALLLALVAGASACSDADARPDAAADARLASAENVAASDANQGPTVEVWKSPTCGCCSKWVDHMRENGFHVVAHDTSNVDAIKREQGLPAGLNSCHTAVVDGLVVEGHVPAADVRRLLAERPEGAAGLAVPGMPMGSPGMEGMREDPYETVLFKEDGTTEVFAFH